jgi:two-component system, OmpR family, phosphate regulon sensor histidine kinase PhoR
VFNSSKGIIIIILSVIALIGLQGLWLNRAIESEKQNLMMNTRLAAIAALSKLEQKEDVALLVTNLDTTINFNQTTVTKKTKRLPKVNVIIANKQQVITIKGDKNNKGTTHTYSFHTDSTTGEAYQTTSTYSSETEEITTITNEKVNDKLKDYELLLKKIVLQTKNKNIGILQRIKFDSLVSNVNEQLKERGIVLQPELAIMKNSDSLIKQTIAFKSNTSTVSLPMFTKDIINQNYDLKISYPTYLQYYFQKAIGIIVLSVGITILLIVLIVLLYKRMRSEQQLNQFKNDFINNLTHELKTPLATISLANTNISTKAKYSNDESTLAYTTIVNEESMRLNNHIEKVLALSFLEKNAQVLSNSLSDVHQLLKDAAKQMQSISELKNGKIELNLNAVYSQIVLDPIHFSNCMNCLLDNALKYTEVAPHIVISTFNEAHQLCVSIKDNGIGIESEYQKRVFEKFFRVTDKNIHTTKGFGLGLSYVKQVVDMLNGSINLISEKNKGSEFIIYLPDAKN